MLTNQADLEEVIAFELAFMRSRFLLSKLELDDCLDSACDPPTPRQSQSIAYAHKALEKANKQPKQITIINCAAVTPGAGAFRS